MALPAEVSRLSIERGENVVGVLGGLHLPHDLRDVPFATDAKKHEFALPRQGTSSEVGREKKTPRHDGGVFSRGNMCGR